MELLMDGSWRCVGASAVGVSHGRTGQPCQDAFGYKTLDNGTVIGVVADGAGSAEFGGLGAAMAVQIAVDSLTIALKRNEPKTYPEWVALFQSVLNSAQQAILQQAESQGNSARDFAATLLVVVASPHQIVLATVGDCAAVIQDRQGNLVSLCQPQRGEYANATHFITGIDAAQKMAVRLRKFYAANPVVNVALMTDGLLEMALNVAQNRPFPPFFQPLFGFISDVDADGESAASDDLASFLDSERVNSRTHDDKTLVLLRHIGR